MWPLLVAALRLPPPARAAATQDDDRFTAALTSPASPSPCAPRQPVITDLPPALQVLWARRAAPIAVHPRTRPRSILLLDTSDGMAQAVWDGGTSSTQSCRADDEFSSQTTISAAHDVDTTRR